MSLQKRFVQNFRQRGFYQPGRTVLLAVSGGVDSMVMASLFLEHKMSFAIAHCNFQLRGEESDKDEELVRTWCKENNIVFHVVRFDTQSKVDQWKKGTQETARILRYEWLETLRAEHGYSFIATAHHANDNAETLLMNLFKGTGISGLHGILHQNGHIIRPLLFAEKAEMLEYADEYNVPYRNDSSNETDKYLRNDIRLNILPVIEKAFPNVVTRLSDNIQRFAEVEQIYNQAIQLKIKKLVEKRGQDVYIPVNKLMKLEAVSTICYELFKEYGFSSAQIPHIVDLLISESGHYIVSDSHRVIKDRDFLIITNLAENKADFILVDNIPFTTNASSHTIHFTIVNKPSELKTDNNTALIDIDKVQLPLVLRRWKLGDYFYPLGMGMKKKKLSRFFIDRKMPIHEKEAVWVLENNKRIVWVVGHRLDERFKLQPSTSRVLQIRIH